MCVFSKSPGLGSSGWECSTVALPEAGLPGVMGKQGTRRASSGRVECWSQWAVILRARLGAGGLGSIVRRQRGSGGGVCVLWPWCVRLLRLLRRPPERQCPCVVVSCCCLAAVPTGCTPQGAWVVCCVRVYRTGTCFTRVKHVRVCRAGSVSGIVYFLVQGVFCLCKARLCAGMLVPLCHVSGDSALHFLLLYECCPAPYLLLLHHFSNVLCNSALITESSTAAWHMQRYSEATLESVPCSLPSPCSVLVQMTLGLQQLQNTLKRPALLPGLRLCLGPQLPVKQ